MFVLVRYLFEDEAHEVISISLCKKMRTSIGAKQKICDRVKSHKTPSAIFDDLFSRAFKLKNVCTCA